MEKEKQDASSPRGVLEAYATAFESDAVTPENGSLELESRPTSRAVSHWRNFFKLWNKRSIKRLASFPPLGVPKFPRRKCKNERESPLLTNVYNFKSSLVNFTFSELQTATNNFSDGLYLSSEISTYYQVSNHFASILRLDVIIMIVRFTLE